MAVDLVEMLRELNFTIAEGTTSHTWLLRSPAGESFVVEPTPPIDRITAHQARNVAAHLTSNERRMLVGRTITPGVLNAATAGEVDVLVEEPLQLIVQGRRFSSDETERKSERRLPIRKRPAWFRWAVERCLLLADKPLRQSVIADLLGTSQQSVSYAAHRLGELVDDAGDGLAAVNKTKLLHHWVADYPGPNGQEFGWYSLDPVVDQTLKAADVATLLEANPLISGDVAADRLAPWKLPSRGRIYVDSPVDLAGDGYVPSPVAEATLITCVPRDPTVWKLSGLGPGSTPAEANLADTAIVYWDVFYSGDIDSEDAASRLEKLLIKADHGEHE